MSSNSHSHLDQSRDDTWWHNRVVQPASEPRRISAAASFQLRFLCTPTAEHLQRQIEHLLSKHEVDLVFSGHVHSYARTCNVLAGKCVDMEQGGCAHLTNTILPAQTCIDKQAQAMQTNCSYVSLHACIISPHEASCACQRDSCLGS